MRFSAAPASQTTQERMNDAEDDEGDVPFRCGGSASSEKRPGPSHASVVSDAEMFLMTLS